MPYSLLFALGGIQALQCYKSTCPTGFTTHDTKLQRGLVPAGKAERVKHYHKNDVTLALGPTPKASAPRNRRRGRQ